MRLDDWLFVESVAVAVFVAEVSFKRVGILLAKNIKKNDYIEKPTEHGNSHFFSVQFFFEFTIWHFEFPERGTPPEVKTGRCASFRDSIMRG